MTAIGMNPSAIRRVVCPTCSTRTEYISSNKMTKIQREKGRPPEITSVVRCQNMICGHDIILDSETVTPRGKETSLLESILTLGVYNTILSLSWWYTFTTYLTRPPRRRL